MQFVRSSESRELAVRPAVPFRKSSVAAWLPSSNAVFPVPTSKGQLFTNTACLKVGFKL